MEKEKRSEACKISDDGESGGGKGKTDVMSMIISVESGRKKDTAVAYVLP